MVAYRSFTVLASIALYTIASAAPIDTIRAPELLPMPSLAPRSFWGDIKDTFTDGYNKVEQFIRPDDEECSGWFCEVKNYFKPASSALKDIEEKTDEIISASKQEVLNAKVPENEDEPCGFFCQIHKAVNNIAGVVSKAKNIDLEQEIDKVVQDVLGRIKEPVQKALAEVEEESGKEVKEKVDEGIALE